ncbi:Transcription factor [Penicillium sp. IBT 35674x]|nr:Transcription factor [Penicillium sp. IBT 35674x]
MSPSKSQVKLACLACRSYKTRCDGQQPCANCSSNQRECHYRPSRRGGARRGQRYQNAKRGCTGAVNNSPPVPSTSPETNDPFGGHLANSLHSFLSVQRRREIVNADIADDSNATTSHSAFDQPTESLFIRSYQDENDLVNAYYIFIHPYLPLLPPQNFPRLADNPKKVFMRCLEPNKSSLPFWPTSSFSLALMALLVLLPLPEDADPMQMAQVELRRSYADLYAREALESIEKSSNGQEHTSAAPISTLEMDKVPRSSIHPKLPCTLEPVLALLLLGVYEYCQNSNRRQMRSRVYGALILAMDLSLHIRDTNNSYNWDVQPRMFLVYQAAIFNHSSPIILLDDPRITTPFPDFSGCQELWPKLMKAQEVMLKAGVLAKEMTEGKVKGSPESFRKSVCELDSLILTVISELNRPPECQPCEGADTAALDHVALAPRSIPRPIF